MRSAHPPDWKTPRVAREALLALPHGTWFFFRGWSPIYPELWEFAVLVRAKQRQSERQAELRRAPPQFATEQAGQRAAEASLRQQFVVQLPVERCLSRPGRGLRCNCAAPFRPRSG